MAGEPAIDKIATGIETALSGLAGVTVDIDRAEDEAWGAGEIPGVNVIHEETEFSQFDNGSTLHRARFTLDLVEDVSAEEGLKRKLRELEADVVAALWADRTLGGIAQDVVPLSAGGDDDVRADEGIRPLFIEVLFLTPIGDHRTIIGASGLVP